MATSHITDFIQSLNPEESKIVNKYLSRAKEDTKIGKLFTMLISGEERIFSDGELSRSLNCTSATIRTLKSRLFDQVKEALVLDEHFGNKNVFNERERIVFELKKKILLTKVLYRTLNDGRIETVNSLLSEIIKQAKVNEVYDILIEALTLKKYIKGLRHGITEFKEINLQIDFYKECLESVQRACDAYHIFILNQGFVTSLSKKKLGQHLKNSIQQMENDFKLTKSQEVNYYLHIFHIVLYDYERRYQEAISYYKKLLSILKNNSVIYSKDRIGFALSNLSQYSLLIGNYKEALIHIKNAERFHIPKSISSLITKEQEFYVYFYSKNYNEAYKCIQEMLEHSMIDSGKYRKSKFMYYQACVLFMNDKIKDASQLLNKSLEIEKDKTGWNIALKLLIIMIFIETNKNINASKSIEALRKYTGRYKMSNPISQRNLLIIKLIREIEKDRFLYQPKNTRAAKMLKDLSEKNKPISWNYYTPELIPFHEWVKTLPKKN